MQFDIGMTGLWDNLRKDFSSNKVTMEKHVFPVLYMWHLGALTFKKLFQLETRAIQQEPL